MKKKLLILILFILFICEIKVSAEEDFIFSDFSYEVNYPKNQTKEHHNYLDLTVSPNTKQEIEVKLYNHSDKKLLVNIGINQATTNGSGTIEYGATTFKNTENLQYNIKKLIEVPESIIVAAHKEKTIKLILNIPKKSFTGLLVGGLEINPNIIENETIKSNTVEIKNEFAYIIGIVLREEEKLNNIKEKVELNSIDLEKIDSKLMLITELANESPIFIEKATLKIDIKKVGEKNFHLKQIFEDLRIAPNSIMAMQNEIEKPFTKGNYNATIYLSTPKMDWSWNRKFKVTQQIKVVQEEKKKVQRKPVLIKIWGVYIMIIICSGIVFYLLKVNLSSKRR